MNRESIRKRMREVLRKVDDPLEFTRGFQGLLKSFVDEEATRNYRRIIPDARKFYGVPMPVLGVMASEVGKFIRNEPTKARGLLNVIWSEGSFEAKQIAGKSLERFGPENPKACLDFVSSVLPDLDNWSVCDNLAMFGVEPIVYSKPELVLPLTEGWIRSEDKWVRRFGVVTLRGYKRVKTTDRVFRILDTVMEDDDKDVKKAVSWVLREITKGNPSEVTEFLYRWAKVNPSRGTKWIIRDGMRKLPGEVQTEILRLIGE